MSVVSKLESKSVSEIKRRETQCEEEEELKDKTNRLTSGEILINSLDHNFKFGFRTSSRNVINNPQGCGRLATSRSNKTLENSKTFISKILHPSSSSYRTICSCNASEFASANKYKSV